MKTGKPDSGVRRVTKTKGGKSVSTKQRFTPTAPSAGAPSGTLGVEMNERNWHATPAEEKFEAAAHEMEQATNQVPDQSTQTLDGRTKTIPAASDAQIRGWLLAAETDLYQQNIEKVRGARHWRVKHLSTHRPMYDLYPEWRIQNPLSYWEAVLCSCPAGYVRGAPCEHKATLRVWCSRHRGAEGVKELLDKPI